MPWVKTADQISAKWWEHCESCDINFRGLHKCPRIEPPNDTNMVYTEEEDGSQHFTVILKMQDGKSMSVEQLKFAIESLFRPQLIVVSDERKT